MTSFKKAKFNKTHFLGVNFVKTYFKWEKRDKRKFLRSGRCALAGVHHFFIQQAAYTHALTTVEKRIIVFSRSFLYWWCNMMSLTKMMQFTYIFYPWFFLLSHISLVSLLRPWLQWNDIFLLNTKKIAAISDWAQQNRSYYYVSILVFVCRVYFM